MTRWRRASGLVSCFYECRVSFHTQLGIPNSRDFAARLKRPPGFVTERMHIAFASCANKRGVVNRKWTGPRKLDSVIEH